MKRAGIVSDDYKVERFKKELIAAGFTDFKVFPFTEGVSTIQVNTEDHRLLEIHELCMKVDFHFKHAN